MTEFSPIPHPIDASRPPPFHDWNEADKRFERMAMTLLGLDERFIDADLFGIGGVKQYGVDATATLRGSDRIVVQSSKCYVRTTPAQLRGWSDEFLEHTETYWAGRKVAGFVLATAATNITDLPLRDEIAREKIRFKALGIDYEVWGPEQLYERLGRSRRTVLRFLNPVWAYMMFGPEPAPAAMVPPELIAQLHQAHTSLSEQVAARLTDAVALLRAEDFDQVETVLALVQGATWPQLSLAVKAQALQLTGDLAHTRGDAAAAREACQAASALDPTDRRLSAALAAREDVGEGLRILGEPINRRGLQLQAGLLLELGEADQAMTVIGQLKAERADDPEDAKLEAYAFLLQDRRPEGLQAALRAEALAPHWPRIVKVAAEARYVCGFILSAPMPNLLHQDALAWGAVRTDTASLNHRRAALAGFTQLAGRNGAGRELQLACLACLACLPDRQVEAATLAQTLIDADPDWPAPVGWVLMRNYPIDLTPTCEALSARIAEDTASVHQVAMSAAVQAKLKGEEAAAQALTAGLQTLTGEALEAAQAWIGRLTDTAPEDDVALPWPSVSAALTSGEADDYSQIESLLAEHLGGDRPGLTGFNLASMASQRGWWSVLVPYVEALARFGSLEALKLALLTLHNTARPQAVLALLAEHRNAYAGDDWPAILQRVEIKSLAESDGLPRALVLAQALAAQTGAAEDRRLLAQLHVSSGDTKTGASIVRRLLRDQALPTGEAMRYSIALTREDRVLARALWRWATAQGLPEALLLAALNQAFKLGLDKEVGPLMGRLSARAQAGGGGVWTVSIEDLPETMRRRREHIERVTDHWQAGAIPVHLAAAGLGAPLTQLLQFGAPSSARAPQQAMFLRHGARPVELTPGAPWSGWQVLMDPTALLIAHQLDLLDRVEALPKPIIVSRHMVEALSALERDITHQQVARVEAAKAMVAAVTRDDLRLAATAFSEQETVRHARSRREVSEAGPTLEAVRAALQALGEAAPDPSADVGWDGEASDGEVCGQEAGQDDALVLTPQAQDRLVFIDNTLETLALDGHLEAVLRKFVCEIPASVHQRWNEEIAAAQAGDALADTVAALRERVAGGLQTGRYVYPPQSEVEASVEEDTVDADPNGDDDDDAGPDRSSPLEQSLFDLIAAPRVADGMVWVDDRYLSGYTQTNGNQVIGVVEVLNALVAAEMLTLDERRLKLLKLRQAGAVFIPLTVEEVIEPLLQAPLAAGALVETPALTTLRRNLATALLLDPHLKIGPSGYAALNDRPDEMHFLQAAQRVVADSLEAVWLRPDATAVDCRARSDWLWSALRMERCVRALPQEDSGLGNQVFNALLVAGVLSTPASWIFQNSLSATLARQAQFLDWAVTALLAAREGQDDAFLDLVAPQMRALLGLAFERPLSDRERGLAVRLRQELLKALPTGLRHKILADPAFGRNVGITLQTSLELGGRRFHNAEFWRACARALRQGGAQVLDLERRRVRLTRRDDHVVLDTTPPLPVREPFFDLLTLQGAPQGEAALAYLETLDLAPLDLESFREQVSDAADEGDLCQIFIAAEQTDVYRHYVNLVRDYESEDALPPSRFRPPRADRLLHALRLGPRGQSWPQRVAQAWARFADAFSEIDAFTELAGLPVDLAGLLHQRNVDLSALGPPATPMARLHLAALAHRRGEDPSAQLVALVAADGEAWLFVALLNWTFKAFQGDDTWKVLEPDEQLALVWTHAHRLSTLIAERTDAPAEMAEVFFDAMPERPLADVIAEQRLIFTDCAFPQLVQPPALICHGLAYVFGDGPVWLALSPRMQSVLTAALTVTQGERVLLSPALLNRTELAGNLLGSWLGRWPVQPLEEEFDPQAYRTAQIDSLLSEIEADPADPAAWQTLARLGRPLLQPDHQARLDRAFEPLALWDVHDRSDQGLSACVEIVAARMRLGGPIDENLLLGKLHALAAAAAKAYPGVVHLGDEGAEGARGERGRAFAAVGAVLGEVAKAEGRQDVLQRLHGATLALAHGWPAAVPGLREVFDRFVRQTSPRDLTHLWRTFVALRSWL